MNDDVLNCQEALAFLSNKQHLYRRLLERFLLSEKQKIYDIVGLLNQDKFEDAARAAHSVKGLSLNLGATALQQISFQLDTMFKTVTKSAPKVSANLLSKTTLSEETALLDQYTTILANTVDAIETWLSENPN